MRASVQPATPHTPITEAEEQGLPTVPRNAYDEKLRGGGCPPPLLPPPFASTPHAMLRITHAHNNPHN